MTQNTSRGKRFTGKNINRHLRRNHNRRKKNIKDYVFYLVTSKQASDFEISSKYILNYIKGTFERGNDIAESLQTLTRIDTWAWRPQLEISKAKNANTREVENKQFELKFKPNLQESIQSSAVYEENL